MGASSQQIWANRCHLWGPVSKPRQAGSEALCAPISRCPECCRNLCETEIRQLCLKWSLLCKRSFGLSPHANHRRHQGLLPGEVSALPPSDRPMAGLVHAGSAARATCRWLR